MKIDLTTLVYERVWFVLLFLVLIPPVGLVFLWLSYKFTAKSRLILTIIFGIWTLLWFVGLMSPKTQPQQTTTEQTVQQISPEDKAAADSAAANKAATDKIAADRAAANKAAGDKAAADKAATDKAATNKAATIEGAISATDRTKGSTISEATGKGGVPELVIDSTINDYSPKSSAYAVCYDACEALKNVPDLQNYGDIMFNFNGEYTMKDGTTQIMPVIRLRYTIEQINNFDFSSRDYVGFENIADVVKMDVK